MIPGMSELPPDLGSRVVSRKQVITDPVIPAKAGIQSARLWIPASAGITRGGFATVTKDENRLLVYQAAPRLIFIPKTRVPDE
jgi:hypothetical protein